MELNVFLDMIKKAVNHYMVEMKTENTVICLTHHTM